MFWYIVICLLMLFPMFVQSVGMENVKRVAPRLLGKQKTRKKQHTTLAIACVILALFMACRSKWVGVDTKFYCAAFTYLQDVDFANLFSTGIYIDASNPNWNLDFEPGYRLCNKLLGLFFTSQQTITVFNSLVILYLLYHWIRKESCDDLLSVWLYITLGIYQTEMNVARNAIAILLCYNALPHVKRGRFWRYTAVVLLAASFHKSTLLFIPLYFVFRMKLSNRRSPLVLMLYSVLLGLLSLQVLPLVRYIMPGFASRYLKTSTSLEAVTVGAFYALLVIFVWLNLKGTERKNARKNAAIGWWLLLLNLFSFAINTQIKYAARLAALFGSYMIVFIPQLLHQIEGKKRYNQTKALIVIGCGVQYILRMMINNIGGTLPYSFFW